MLASKEKGAAIKMADFGLAVMLAKNQDKGWFGELQTFVSHFMILLIVCQWVVDFDIDITFSALMFLAFIPGDSFIGVLRIL